MLSWIFPGAPLSFGGVPGKSRATQTCMLITKSGHMFQSTYNLSITTVKQRFIKIWQCFVCFHKLSVDCFNRDFHLICNQAFVQTEVQMKFKCCLLWRRGKWENFSTACQSQFSTIHSNILISQAENYFLIHIYNDNIDNNNDNDNNTN